MFGGFAHARGSASMVWKTVGYHALAALAVLVCLALAPGNAQAADILVPTTFTGGVTAPTDGAIVVTLYEQTCTAGQIFDSPWVAVATTMTVSDGSFSLGPYRANPAYYYTVGFKHPSPEWGETFWCNTSTLGVTSISAASSVRPGLNHPFLVALRSTCRVSGTVTGRNGGPVCLAEVTLYRDSQVVHSAYTDINGAYSFDGVTPGTYTVKVDEYRTGDHQTTYSGNAADASSAATYTLAAGQSAVADIAMRWSTVFTGRLMLPNGLPADNVAIRLWKWNEVSSSWDTQQEPWGDFAQTGPDGRWRYSSQSAGRFKIGYDPVGGSNDVLTSYYRSASTFEAAQVIEAADAANVTVDDTATVGGQLHVACLYQGALQEPATAVVYRRDEASGAWSVYATATYNYASVFRSLPPGTYRISAQAWGQGWGLNMRSVFFPDSATMEGATDIVIRSGGSTSVVVSSYAVESISGSVASALSGEGVGNAEVTLWSKSADGAWDVFSTHGSAAAWDRNGLYSFEDVPPGVYRMTLHDPAGAFQDLGYPSGTGLQDATDIVVGRGAVLSIDPRMQPVLGTISGVVRDSVTNLPMPGVRIGYFAEPRNRSHGGWLEAGPPVAGTLVTDPDGRYRIDYEMFNIGFALTDPSGTHTAIPFSTWTMVQMVPGADTVHDLVMVPRSRVSGTVIDASTHAPLAGIRVSVSGAQLITTGPDGRFSTELLEPGWYTVSASDPTARYLPTNEVLPFVVPGIVATLTVQMTRDTAIPDTDKTAPKTTSNALASYPGIGTISLSAVDAPGGSGVAHTYCVLDDGAMVEDRIVTVSQVGAHKLQFWSVDASGNSEKRNVVPFVITAVAPRPLAFSEVIQVPEQRWGFSDPKHATVDSAGTLWVSMRDRLRRYSPDGAYLGYDLSHNGCVRAAAGEGVYAMSATHAGRIDHLTSDGSVLSSIEVTPSAAGSLEVKALSIGPDGDLYVADAAGGRILRYHEDGALVRVYAFGAPAGLMSGATGGLADVTGVAVDAAGTVYVAEGLTKDIQLFAADGTPGIVFACSGQDGKRVTPLGVEISPQGDLLVNMGPQVWTVSTAGEWLAVFCSDPAATTSTEFQTYAGGAATWTDMYGQVVRLVDANGTILRAVGARVDHVDRFSGPTALAFGPGGRGYVTDGDAHVHMIDENGGDMGVFPLPVTPVQNAWPKSGAVAVDASGHVFVPDPDYFVKQINEFSSDGQFIRTVLQGEEAGPGIGFGTNGHMYVTDVGGRSVLHFGEDRQLIGSWRSMFRTVENYFMAQPLATAPSGEVLVGQQLAMSQAPVRVLRYSAGGIPLGTFAPAGEQEISGIACAPDGTVFVSDSRSRRVEYFGATGVYQGAFTGTEDMQFVSPRGLAFDRLGRLWVTDGNDLRCFDVAGLISRHTVTPTPCVHGAMSGAKSVSHGGSATFTVTPAVGYHVARVWLDAGTALASVGGVYTVVNVTADHTITATFARNALPKAIVYAPHAPSTMHRNHHYTIYGYMRPKHASGTYLVQLNFYKKNSHGTYVYHHHVHAKRYDHSSTMTKYKASVSLSHSGVWRVRAVHSCSSHATTYGAYDYITVE